MEHVRHGERHASDFVSSRGYRSTWFPDETSMICKDDPEHQQQRKLISDLFTPRAVNRLEDDIRADVADALAATRIADRFEVVDTIAGRIPAVVTCRILGWPTSHWRDAMSWPGRVIRAAVLATHPRAQSDARRAGPGHPPH